MAEIPGAACQDPILRNPNKTIVRFVIIMKRKAVVDKDRCVACGACADACPRSAIAVHKGCYARTDDDRCVGCAKCEKVCPAGCIRMKECGQNEA